jgi:hypothetical protein
VAPDKFLDALQKRGFKSEYEDPPHDLGETLLCLMKVCHEPDCPQHYQQHFMAAADLYHPEVLDLLYAKIEEGDCGHSP